jgi:hypothetical protein
MERDFDNEDMPDKPPPPEGYEVPEASEELPQPNEQPEDSELL